MRGKRITYYLFFITVLFSTLLFECKSDDDKIPEEICNNGIDDDGDGFADCEDFDCDTFECNCSDGIDNDADGFTDCEDIDCNC